MTSGNGIGTFSSRRLAWLLFICSLVWPQLGLAEPINIRVMSQTGFTAKYNYSNSARPGICIEIIRAIERVDPDLHFVGLEKEAAYLRIEREVQAGRLDAYVGLGKTAERATRLRYLEDPPIYFHRNWLVVRADDDVQVNSFDDIRKLGKDGVILSIHANLHTMYMKSHPGLIVDDASSSMEDNLRKLIAGRGRFFYGPDIAIKEDFEKPSIKGKVKLLKSGIKLPQDNIYIVFSKTAPQRMVDRVQIALKKLQKSGELEKIHAKYALHPLG